MQSATLEHDRGQALTSKMLLSVRPTLPPSGYSIERKHGDARVSLRPHTRKYASTSSRMARADSTNLSSSTTPLHKRPFESQAFVFGAQGGCGKVSPRPPLKNAAHGAFREPSQSSDEAHIIVCPDSPSAGRKPLSALSEMEFYPPTSRTGKSRSSGTRPLRTTTSPKMQALGLAIDEEAKCKVNLRIPQRLPMPSLQVVSSPHDNLVSHLEKHGLSREAAGIHDSNLPVDYLLAGYVFMGQTEASSLYEQVASFVPRFKDQLQSQIGGTGQLPTSFKLDLHRDSCGTSLPPTHLFAVHKDSTRASLFAGHAMVLALQCCSIPFLPAVPEPTTPSSARTLPVVRLVVPHPELFHITYRWLYDQESGSLFRSLIPTVFVARYLATKKVEQGEQSIHSVAGALSNLSTRELLDSLQLIQGVWKNGAALGILSTCYWSQLEKAWEYVVAALVLARKRKASTVKVEEARADLEYTSL